MQKSKSRIFRLARGHFGLLQEYEQAALHRTSDLGFMTRALVRSVGKGPTLTLGRGDLRRVIRYGRSLKEKSQLINSFVSEYPTPKAAFEVLSGIKPSGEIKWIIKPYGIYFYGDERAFRKAGWLHISARAELIDYGRLKNKRLHHLIACGLDRESAKHELSHAAQVGTKTHRLSETLNKNYNIRACLTKFNPSNAARDYPKMLKIFANGGFKSELIVRVLSDQIGHISSNRAESRGLIGPYIWDSYQRPPMYLLYTATSPPFEGKRNGGLNKLWNELTKKRGLTKNKRWVVSQKLLDRINYYEAPYRNAYEQIINKVKLALTKGISKEEVAIVIEQSDFLKISEQLDKLIAKG